MQHLVAYGQSVDQGDVAAAINAVPDPSVYVVGTQIRVPSELPFLGGAVCLSDATTLTDFTIRTPTLRELFYPSLTPFVNDVSPSGVVYPLPYFPEMPLALKGLEQMEAWPQTDNTGAAGLYGLAWLQDGPIAPVKGPITTIRATGAATLSAYTWVNTQLTFSQQLPVGDYQVVGFKAVGANLAAARLYFTGYPWRPGVPGSSGNAVGNFPQFRFGASGVMGVFNNNVPPTVDCLGATDTTQVFYLDLIKIS